MLIKIKFNLIGLQKSSKWALGKIKQVGAQVPILISNPIKLSSTFIK